MVGRGGLEPPTSRLSGVRSNHLSYRPILVGPVTGRVALLIVAAQRLPGRRALLRKTLGGA